MTNPWSQFMLFVQRRHGMTSNLMPSWMGKHVDPEEPTEPKPLDNEPISPPENVQGKEQPKIQGKFPEKEGAVTKEKAERATPKTKRRKLPSLPSHARPTYSSQAKSKDIWFFVFFLFALCAFNPHFVSCLSFFCLFLALSFFV